MEMAVLRIEGEIVGWEDLIPRFFLIYKKSTSHWSSLSEFSLADTGEFIPAMKLLCSLLSRSLDGSCEEGRGAF